jgi:hypothetical protein
MTYLPHEGDCCMLAGRAKAAIVAVLSAAWPAGAVAGAEATKPNRPAGRLTAIAEVMAHRPRPEVIWGGRTPLDRLIRPVQGIRRSSRYARWITPPAPTSADQRIAWTEPRRLYQQLIEPLTPRSGRKLPVRAHGYYCFAGRTSLAEMAACAMWYNRLKERYPTASVVLNRELLADPQTCSMLTTLLKGDILAWVVPSAHAGDLEGLARFLGRYGQRVVAVVVGRHPMLPATATSDDVTRGDLWLGFLRYALPGRPVLGVRHTGQATAAADPSARNTDGVLLWNDPGIRSGKPPLREALTSTLTLATDTKTFHLAGDWGADLPPATDVGDELARGEKTVADNLAGYVRCVGVIPGNRPAAQANIDTPKAEKSVSLSVKTSGAVKLKPVP